MEIPTLKAEPRQAAGSRAATRLRRDGKLPAVVYGHKQSSESVSLTYRDVETYIEHGLHVIKLDLSGQVQPCQFKQAQAATWPSSTSAEQAAAPRS